MTLTINRKTQFADLERNYEILINEKECGLIGRKDTLTINNLSGKLKIMAKLDWCKSQEFTLDADQTENFKLTIRNGMTFLNYSLIFAFLIAIIGRLFFPQVEEVHNIYMSILFLIFLGNVYRYTMGRNNYLIIEEEK